MDTAGRACSAALYRQGVVCARRFERMERGQSERLLPMVLEVLAEAGCDFAALDRLAVTIGPGAFTGVRIGLATARGLALATGLPLIGITCFEAVVEAVSKAEAEGQWIVVALDAKRRDLFAQCFDAEGRPEDAGRALLPEQLGAWIPAGPVLLAGDAAPTARWALESIGRTVAIAKHADAVDAALVAACAARRPVHAADASPLRPLYLRPPDVTLPTGSATAAAER